MNLKILKYAAIILLLARTMIACEDEKKDGNPVLKGTSWKLIGFMDVEPGKLRKAEPEDCQRCYTITFDTDTTFSGLASSNLMHGYYKIDYQTTYMQIVCGTTTEVIPYFDEEIFVETMNLVLSFSLQNDELRLYYKDKKNYLLFKSKIS
ncbi:MAG: META domain-containing protein [Prevotellaceae bacterium]|jgi:hypothetical protein|nr:META domain-containing protein [Prevotellaceae bacterium]